MLNFLVRYIKNSLNFKLLASISSILFSQAFNNNTFETINCAVNKQRNKRTNEESLIMSLTGKLAKIAIGIAVAKGVKKMMGGKQQQSGGMLGGLLGKLTGSNNHNQSGGLGSILGQLGQSSGQQDGLGGLLGNLASGNGGSQSGLGGVLGGLLSGDSQQSQAGGGLGGLLGSLSQGSASGGLGGLLNSAMDNLGEPNTLPTAEEEAEAGVLLSAMLQAAKADGQVDAEEQKAIMEHLSDATPEEMAFIQQQMNAPVDPQGLANKIPNGMQQQAYAMSLLAIDVDNQNEAQYLDQFAKALNLDAQTVNAIHTQMDEPTLYS